MGCQRVSVSSALTIWGITLAFSPLVMTKSDSSFAARPSACRAQEGLVLDAVKFPKADKTLSTCEQYKDCTCCNSSHTAMIQHSLDNVFSSADVSSRCRSATSMLSCRVCDPEVGVGNKHAICESTCNDWYESCRGDYFAFTSLSQRLQLCDDRQVLCSPLKELATNGRELCKMAGFKTSRSNCFNGRKVHHSSHGLCSHSAVSEDDDKAKSMSTVQLILMWLGLSLVAAFLGPKFFMQLHGFRRAYQLMRGNAEKKRTRGIGSGDPQTDPYYMTNSRGDSSRQHQRRE
mmetsp:Transcript_27302/g.51983  ORF Transcript_27302/g.51983 Transcript_27302/m.51983 type:complete len:289 (+) Transcript_27302:32-898(+)